MKKLMFLAITVLLLISCSKKDDLQNAALSPLATEVLKQSDFTSMRQAYQLLAIDEKKILWVEKFKTVLKNDKQNLTKEQYGIIIFINNFLNETTFEKIKQNPEIGEKFLSENLENFQIHFSKVELYMLLQSPYFDESFSVKKSKFYADELSKTEYSNAINIEPNNFAPNPCECKYDLGCPGGGNDCITGRGGCSETRDGCGIFGTSSCTGRCELSPA